MLAGRRLGALNGAPTEHREERAWTREELREDPHASSAKGDKVRRMFGAIAHRYDLNNTLHSFGRDGAWRRAAVEAAGVSGSDEVLDVACGTGALTREFARRGPARVVGLDYTPEMLDVARERAEGAGSDGRRATPIEYVQGDAMALPFGGRSFDVVSIAFGIRNVEEPERALAEFRRVLRPGGRLVVLEFDTPRLAPLAWMNGVYTRAVMPRTATLISGDRSGAYWYLPRSVSTFLCGDELAERMRVVGFSPVESRRMTFGVVSLHVGTAS